MLRLLKTYFSSTRTLKTWDNIIKSPAPDLSDIYKNIGLQEYLLNKIRKWPDDKVAVECIDTKRKYTYLELRRKSLALTHFLRNSMKLEENSRVGILLPNLPEYPIILLALIQAGLQISPINPNYTQDEIKKQLVYSKAKVLFASAEREKELRNVCDDLRISVIAVKTDPGTSLSSGTINFFDYVTTDKQNQDEIYTNSVTPDDVALLPFSSGTTGLPKGVQLTNKNLVCNLIQSASRDFNFYENDQDVALAFLPFFHIYGLMMVLLHGLCEGVTLVTIPKFTSHNFMKGLREYRPTFIPSVPPVVHLINTHPHIKQDDLSSLRSLLSGAAPLSETDVLRFKNVTGGKVNLKQSYGMTEASPLVCIQTTVLEGGIKVGGCGYLIQNTIGKFISPEDTGNQQALGVGEEGELLIKGPQVMKGYLDNPEATKETLTEDGWLRSGDIGYHDEDGHLFITDRKKELIKVHGFQVPPAELEAIIRNHPSVRDVAVIGVKDERLGEAPKAFVVKKRDARVGQEDIQRFVAEKVVKYKHLVGGVTFLDDIPRTASGKILRRDLRKLSD